MGRSMGTIGRSLALLCVVVLLGLLASCCGENLGDAKAHAASRVLLQQTAAEPREPGDLVGAIGTGLFLLILFGVIGIVGCLAAETNPYAGVIRFGFAFLWASLLTVMLVLPKKRRGEEVSNHGQFYSTWLWTNLVTYIIMGVGLTLAVLGITINFLAVPIYALEDDRMARKG